MIRALLLCLLLAACGSASDDPAQQHERVTKPVPVEAK